MILNGITFRLLQLSVKSANLHIFQQYNIINKISSLNSLLNTGLWKHDSGVYHLQNTFPIQWDRIDMNINSTKPTLQVAYLTAVAVITRAFSADLWVAIDTTIPRGKPINVGSVIRFW